MPRLFALFLGAVVRWAWTLLAGVLIGRGVITQKISDQVLAGLVTSLPPLVWALWQKYKSRLKFLTALQLPAQASEGDVKEILSNSTFKEKLSFIWGVLGVQLIAQPDEGIDSLPPPPSRRPDPGSDSPSL